MSGLSYLENYESKATRNCYRCIVKDFLTFTKGQEIASDDLGREAVAYFNEPRDYEKDVDAFALRDKGAPPKSRKLKITAIRTYLMQNEAELPEKYWKELKSHIKGSRALTLDRAPTSTELKKMINLMSPQGRALYLVLASSGMRIGESLQLKLSDVDLSAVPVKVSISGKITKTGNSRITFISAEAKEALDQWLALRVRYIEGAAAKSRFPKSIEDDRLFPFDKSTAQNMWTLAIQKAGLEKHDASTGRMEVHIHSLRKYFRTHLGSAISPDVVECLMGHEEALQQVYKRYSIEELGEFYKKGEHSLLVMGNGQDLAKLRAEIDGDKKAWYDSLQHVTQKNADLENRLTALIADNQAMKKDMANLIAMVDKLSAKIEKAG